LTRSSPYTVAHILPFPAVGGTEHATLRIAKAVDSARFRSVAFHLPDAAGVRQFFADAGVPCAAFEPAVPSYRGAAGYLAASWSLARELRRQRVDLVHCADLLAAHGAALAGRMAGVPVICHIRNRFESISRRDCSFLWPVRRFIFVSRSTWTRFGCRVAPSRGVVVYDGIDLPPIARAPGHREAVRSELGIPLDAPLVGMMARVAPQKDYATLARAAARVLRTEPRARFLVAGDYASAPENREHYEQVRRILSELGVQDAFLFTGQRGDVPRLLDALDVFVLSTHWEGLPLVILEAMAHGNPVVATAVDGIPEIVRDGETGLLFDHEDHEALASRLIDLIQDPARAARLADAGRQLVHSRFTVAKFAEGMNAVYADALGA
jgi:glycosyltransferase involved in cell wall biosynthesis